VSVTPGPYFFSEAPAVVVIDSIAATVMASHFMVSLPVFVF
jgi:hypothetical protein